MHIDFLHPHGLFAGLTLPLLVVILYFFRRRFKTQLATGLFLWGLPEQTRLGGRRLDRHDRRRSFWLDLAAALLAALALGAPGCRTAAGRPVVIVLDDSWAMHALGAREKAVRVSLEISQEASRAGRPVTFLLAGGEPRRLPGADDGYGAQRAALDEYEPTAVFPHFDAAIRLALDLHASPPEMHLLTNRRLDADTLFAADMPLTAHQFAGAGTNVAITGVWRETEGETDIIHAAARRFPAGDLLSEWDWVLSGRTRGGSWEDIYAQPLLFDDDGYATAAMAWHGHRDRPLQVELRPRNASAAEDVIPQDSVCPAPPPPLRTLTYDVAGLSPEAALFVRHGLEAAGAVPDSLHPALLVTSDPIQFGSVMTLEIFPPAAPGGLPALGPPFVVDASHPLTRDVRLSSTWWTPALAAAPDAAPGAAISDAASALYGPPWIMAGERPLFWRAGLARLRLDMVPEASGVVLEPAWPALLSNVFAYARRELPGLRKTLYAPGEMPDYRHWPEAAPEMDGEPSGALMLLDSRQRTIWTAERGAGQPLPRRAGWYSLRQGGQDRGILAVRPPWAAAALDTSDLASADERRVIWTADAEAAGRRDLSAYIMGLALLPLLANWRSGWPRRAP